MERNYAAPEPVVRRVLTVAFAAAVLLQVWALYLYVPGPSDDPGIPHVDKLVHAVLFAVPAAVGVLASVCVWRVGLLLAAHAVLSEIVQHRWLAARTGDPWDVVADLVGLAIGLGAGVVVARRAVQPGRPAPSGEVGAAR